ncbi:unnamed protein product [Closterium sp. NIES-53]
MPLKWVLFPEADPVQQFRDKTWKEKIWIFLVGVFPILSWLPKYDLRFYLLGDIIGGLSIAIMSVPQDVSYAKYANAPKEFALYTSFLPPLMYAILGSSKHMVIGPVSVVSQLLGEQLSAQVDPTTDPALYNSLLTTTTFLCGLFQLAMGLLRMGFLVDLLSQPTIAGFLAGCSLTIALQQLKPILGYRDFTLSTSVVNIFKAVAEYSDEFQWRAFVLGSSFFIALTILRILTKMYPKSKTLFYANALGPISSIILSTIIVGTSGMYNKGVATVGSITTGLGGMSSVWDIDLHNEYTDEVALIALYAALVSLAESIGIGRTFAGMYGYHIDGNKELIAYGAMNLSGSFTSCYVATGSFSRTAVNILAGAHTALTQIILSFTMLIVLLAAAPAFKYVPACVVGAVIANSVLNLLDFKAAFTIWRVDKLDFMVMLGCFLGIIFGSPEIGLLVASVLSVLKLLLRIVRPHIRLLGLLPGGAATAVSVLQFPNSTLCEGIVMLRIESPLYFPAANFCRQRIKKLCDAYARGYQQPVRHCILDLSVMHDIDVSGIDGLKELHRDLSEKSIQLCLSSASRDVLRKLWDANFLAEMGEQWLFVTPADAVKLCRSVAVAAPAVKEQDELLASVQVYDI